MRSLALSLCAALALAGCSTAVAHDDGHGKTSATATQTTDGWTAYGAPFSGTQTVVPATELLADPSAHVGKPLRVEGRVATVCQKAGCWMVIAEGEQSMRVLMKDHAFAVDKQGAGSTCQVDGVIVAKQVDPKTVAHFESETEEGALIPEKQAKSDVVYQMVADGVRFKR